MALLVTTIDVFSAGMEATSTHSDLVIYRLRLDRHGNYLPSFSYFLSYQQENRVLRIDHEIDISFPFIVRDDLSLSLSRSIFNKFADLSATCWGSDEREGKKAERPGYFRRKRRRWLKIRKIPQQYPHRVKRDTGS